MAGSSARQGKNYFGGLLAVVLLLLYSTILIYMMVQAVSCGNATPPTCDALIDDKQGMIYVVTTISGLISALVISELAITPAGKAPITHRFVQPADASNPPAKVEKLVRGAITTLTFSYLIMWILLGVAALLIGVVMYPDASMTIRAMGNTWLGLAVAAGYSYFGIKA